MISLLASQALAVAPCATMQMLPDATPIHRGAMPRSAVGLLVHDSYPTPNQITSTHFAAHWGNTGGVTLSDVQALLDAFEGAWDVEIDQMGHPAPATTDAYYFNVYVGDTGDGAPDGYGAGGYYITDYDGFPLVVIALASLQPDPNYAYHAAAHEFYHAIQGSTGRYTYDGVAAWYWEATAEWAAIQVDPSNPYDGPFVGAYLMLPELAVDFFDYPDTGALQEYYQYGAFLFPYDLSQQYGFELVRDSWTVPGSEPDPVEVLRSELAGAGADLDELWLDHLGHNDVFDYPEGDLYRYTTEQWEGSFPSDRVTAQISADGGSGRLQGATAPYRYGAANIELDHPSEGTLEVRITGDASGSEGHAAQWGARLVRDHGDGTYEMLPVPFSGTAGSLDVPDVGAADETVWLSIGAWTGPSGAFDTEQFEADWSLAVVRPTTTPTTTPTDTGTETTDTTPSTTPSSGTTPTDTVPDDEPKDDGGSGGCGCQGNPGSIGGFDGVLVALAGLAARRRRWSRR